jgi:hypothetical protein
MDIEQLNTELGQLALKRNELNTLNYDNEEYDRVEEELHSMEDDFQEKFGDYLEEALSYVHDEFCADNEVLLPIAYVAKVYKVENGNFDVDANQGISVDVDDFPGKDTRLVLVPSPTRILLIVDSNVREEVWRAEPK